MRVRIPIPNNLKVVGPKNQTSAGGALEGSETQAKSGLGDL